MASRVLFVIYDNGSYDNRFPMGVGALSAVLKPQGHEIKIWNQDIHHYADSSLTDYLDKNKFDVVILSLIAGYYQYKKMSEEEIKKETIKWLKNLNKAFGNLLAKEKLIKTGGYDKISKHQNTKTRKETVHKNTTTVETLNYATQEGTVR